MKLTALLTIFLTSSFLLGKAQEKKVFVVKAGEIMSEAIPFSEMYTYPTFPNGTVHFRSGESTIGRLNYNILTSEMDFIDANGDTLALADEPLVKTIVIGKDSFYFSNGYFKIITSSGEFKLGKRDVFTTAKIEKTGAYDQPMPAGMDTYEGFSNGNHVTKLVVKQNITFVKQTAFYFGNKNNEFLPANRKNLMKTFSKQERKIQDYLSVNEINFGEEEDLVKIILYLKTL